jgi:hypothetical protein
MGIIEKLRSDQRVTQYDSAGRTISFDGTPTEHEKEAADHIFALHAAIADIEEYARNGDTIGGHEAIGRAVALTKL